MYQSKVINGNKHYYEITGEGEWVVLIHGWTGSTVMWKKEVEYLSRYFKVLNYDLRGHGRTGESSLTTYDPKLIADDLKGLMDDLGITKAHLCSLNFGAVVAQSFALYYPDLITSQVMIGPPGKHRGFTKTALYLIDKLIGSIFSARIVLEILTFLIMPTPQEKIFRKFFIQESSKVPENEIAKWWNIIKTNNLYENSAPKNFPTLILTGEFDWLFAKQAQQLTDYFPDSILCVIPQTGHMITLQNPVKCKEEILKFYLEIIKKSNPPMEAKAV